MANTVAVIPAGMNRFFWSADSFDGVGVEVRSEAGISIEMDPARSGAAVILAEPGSCTWRAVSAWAGSSDWWLFEVAWDAA